MEAELQSLLPSEGGASARAVVVRVLATTSARTAAANRNVAASAAEGPVLAFLDADDLMHPLRMEAAIECLVRRKGRALLHSYTYDDVPQVRLDEVSRSSRAWPVFLGPCLLFAFGFRVPF